MALAALAKRADVALRERRLCVPDVASRGLHEVACALLCLAELCAGNLRGRGDA